jgi:hypothetical protein
VRRATIAIGMVAILASSCGEAAIPPRLATTLEHRVATIRGLAEDGRPGLAIAATRNLMSLVTDRLHAGKIDDSKAVEILEAARALVDDLEQMARPGADAPSPSAIPSEEDEGGDGDEGKGKGHDEDGDGNEGHGNDED